MKVVGHNLYEPRDYSSLALETDGVAASGLSIVVRVMIHLSFQHIKKNTHYAQRVMIHLEKTKKQTTTTTTWRR
ncbi:hypothetical protein IEQ34_000411 [Dendrobium chrysotoxum]|uniref:Uncharacterized protein n=1 Tax=Dendrobium chrysotoxum TaxID=161865 RepID=A0AAV7HSZ8_DENCH|nr:hypothetical protein IEQ34_000411 [Dendrobium chrysotoxum]